MISRRGFLGLLGAGAAAVAFDPERDLWVPRAKLISIPAAPQVKRFLEVWDTFTIEGVYDPMDRRRLKVFRVQSVELSSGDIVFGGSIQVVS
jgi:hypothetical protein